jgi:Ca2+-binding EF-hand superfamily protein
MKIFVTGGTADASILMNPVNFHQTNRNKPSQMKTQLIVCAVLAFAPALHAQAPKTFSDGTLPEALRQFDVDGNGVLDEEERQAAKAARDASLADRFSRWDTDGDGVISDAEREAAKAAILAKIIEARRVRFAALAGEDGLLSLAEFSSLPPLATRTAEQIATMFGFLDSDDDGFVSLEEFLGRLIRHNGPRP